MSWTKSEREQIDNLSRCVYKIQAAIVGDLNSDKPGLQDRVRDIEKRHKYTFILAASALFGFVINMANGNIEKLIGWALKLL